MTREEAIQTIQEMCKRYIFMLDEDEAIDMAIESLSAEPKWIPCSERLPSDDGDAYLVTDYCPQINRRRIRISYCYANKDGFWSDTPKGYEVIAWMPLPKPYVERREHGKHRE